MVMLGLTAAVAPSTAQQPDPLVRAIAAHGGNVVETVVRIQMRGRSSNGQPVTISASLVGNDANSLRLDYGIPVTKSFISKPVGAAELTVGRPTVWKPAHVGAFAQLDMLSVFGIRHLASPLVQQTVRGAGNLEGRPTTQVRAITERTKKVLRRTVADDVDVQVDQETGVVMEIMRMQRTENNLDRSFLAGFRFSDYRRVFGILLPYQIQRVMNGVVRETITLESIELNPPLTLTFFDVPSKPGRRVVGRRP
jgi:hypothetical protein